MGKVSVRKLRILKSCNLFLQQYLGECSVGEFKLFQWITLPILPLQNRNLESTTFEIDHFKCLSFKQVGLIVDNQ